MLDSRLSACIKDCLDCVVTCQACAAAYLQEPDVKMMAGCIALDLDCADVCATAAKLMARNSANAQRYCQLCAEICRACAKECEQHPADHCQACAKTCLLCAQACENVAA